MSITLNKSMIAAGLALAAASLCAMPSAFAAEPNKPVKAKAVKAKAKPKAPAKDRAHPKAEDVAMPDGPDADITGSTTTEYSCELGTKVTIFHQENDDSHVAIRWKKRIHRLEKVGTTTGARRFENPTFGLIWIGIPSKGMLLDSKLNRQLANECKNSDQEKAVLAPPTVPAKLPSAKVSEVVEPIVPPEPASAPAPAAPVTMPAPVPATPPLAPGAAPVAPEATPATATPPATPATPATPAAPAAPSVPAQPPQPQPQVTPAVPVTTTPVTTTPKS